MIIKKAQFEQNKLAYKIDYGWIFFDNHTHVGNELSLWSCEIRVATIHLSEYNMKEFFKLCESL